MLRDDIITFQIWLSVQSPEGSTFYDYAMVILAHPVIYNDGARVTAIEMGFSVLAGLPRHGCVMANMYASSSGLFLYVNLIDWIRYFRPLQKSGRDTVTISISFSQPGKTEGIWYWSREKCSVFSLTYQRHCVVASTCDHWLDRMAF